MKYLLSFYFFLITLCSLAQERSIPNTPYDSLKKYSYFINGYLKGSWSNGSGSGFFIKEKKAIFFVTNYHVFTGYDPITEQNLPTDTISIRLKTDKDSLFIRIPSHRDSTIEKRIKSLEIGDLVAIQITKKQVKVCNSIGLFYANHLLDISYLTLVPTSIFFYGFPSSEVTYNKLSKMLVPVGQVSYTSFKEVDASAYNLISRRGYILTNTDFQSSYRNKYFLLANASTGGMSGSPVFGEYNIKGKVEYKLLGIIRGGAKGITEAIKIQELFQIISLAANL